MESEWVYRMTQKADADLDDIVGSLAVNEFVPNGEIRKKLAGNYVMYYLPDFAEKVIFILRIVYGRRNTDEILRWMNK